MEYRNKRALISTDGTDHRPSVATCNDRSVIGSLLALRINEEFGLPDPTHRTKHRSMSPLLHADILWECGRYLLTRFELLPIKSAANLYDQEINLLMSTKHEKYNIIFPVINNLPWYKAKVLLIHCVNTIMGTASLQVRHTSSLNPPWILFQTMINGFEMHFIFERFQIMVLYIIFIDTMTGWLHFGCLIICMSCLSYRAFHRRRLKDEGP